jgi:hypothetical protein
MRNESKPKRASIKSIKDLTCLNFLFWTRWWPKESSGFKVSKKFGTSEGLEFKNEISLGKKLL